MNSGTSKSSMSTNTEYYDCAVVGGGPAGTSAAILLAKAGLHVVLFESQHYPHDKVCGEFLSPECNQLLADLGLTDDINAVHPAVLTTARITVPNGTTWETALPANGLGLRRYTLDALMASHARSHGVDVREDTTVTGIAGNLRDGFTLSVRHSSRDSQDNSQAGKSARAMIHAKTVIGAQGKRSLVDRALQRSFLAHPQPYVGLKAHFRGLRMAGRIELHAFPGGYCGISEVEDGTANVCLLVRESTFKAKGGTTGVETFIGWMKTQNAQLGGWLAQATLTDERWLSVSQVPFTAKSAISHDVLMAGDSAGVIAPLAGDGMAMALHAGRLAADHVIGFMQHRLTADQVRQGYPAQWQREFTARLRLAGLIQAVMLRPILLTVGLKLVRFFPALGTYFVSHTRDTQISHYLVKDTNIDSTIDNTVDNSLDSLPSKELA